MKSQRHLTQHERPGDEEQVQRDERRQRVERPLRDEMVDGIALEERQTDVQTAARQAQRHHERHGPPELLQERHERGDAEPRQTRAGGFVSGLERRIIHGTPPPFEARTRKARRLRPPGTSSAARNFCGRCRRAA